MIKTVLFDYAGVITPTRNNYFFALENSDRFKLDPKELMRISYENWAETVIGKQDCSFFWNNIANKLGIEPDELKDLIISTFPIDKGVVDIIRKTKQKYTTVLFSNQIKDWLEKVINDNNLENLFDYLINSYIVGARKPEKKIFLEALRRTSSLPEEVLFIDDSLENIQAAKKLGINIIHYNNFKQFDADYRSVVDIS